MNTLVLVAIIVFYLVAIPAIVGDVLSWKYHWARTMGRIATGLTMLIGGAAVNASFLISGSDYSDFADDSKFGWVAPLWRAVVPPNHTLLIGLLVTFEAIVGILIFSGGWPTRIGLLLAIAFHVAMGTFLNWFYTGYAAVMLVALILLLRTEWREEGAARETRSPLRPGMA